MSAELDNELWVKLLGAVQFFSGFSKDELGTILEHSEIVSYKLHEYIIRENEDDQSFFVILRGSAKLIKADKNSQKKELWHLKKGDCLGEMRLLLGVCRTASILASEECFLFKTEMSNIQKLPEHIKSKLFTNISISLANKLKETTEYAVSPHFY